MGSARCRPPTAGSARGDLANSHHNIEGQFYDWACFAAQQAAEKAATAVLQRQGIEVWGHVVAKLLAEVVRRHAVPDELNAIALELDNAARARETLARMTRDGVVLL